MDRVVTRLAAVDPGYVRVRLGARTVCAVLLSGLTLAATTLVFDIADPLQIVLFGAGVSFFGALLVTDPRRGDRARTFGWASVVAAVALVVTVRLSGAAVWAAVAFLVLLMFLSYALRSWSVRAGDLAVIGALITFLTGVMHISTDRMGWFVLASAVGFAWIAAAGYLILPEDPAQSLKRSVDIFCHIAEDTLTGVIDMLATADDGRATDRARKALRRLRRCRTAIENQLCSAVSTDLGAHRVEELRVALYCAERGAEELVHQADDLWWIGTLPDDVVASLTSGLQELADALGSDIDAHSLDAVAQEAQRRRDASSPGETTDDAPHHAAALATLTTIGAAQLLAQSVSQATALVRALPVPALADGPTAATGTPSTGEVPTRTLEPNMALAIQAALAAVLAGLLAKSLGNEQSLLVAWTAYVVIAGSAEASTRRAWLWLGATVLGATAGVAVAASVPDGTAWILLVVLIGVFFTIVTAAVSYPAMVFWMNISLVPLFATEGLYLDMISDKAVAAFIGGGVAAIVALTVVPLRISRDYRPAVLTYLDALDAALEAQEPGKWDRRATAGAALDRAHSALDSMSASALNQTHLFPQPRSPLNEQAVRIDAVHQAFLRFTPLLTVSSLRLHGWTDRQIEVTIRRLRDGVGDAKAVVGAEASAANTPAGQPVSPESADWLSCGAHLHDRLAEFAALLRGRTVR